MYATDADSSGNVYSAGYVTCSVDHNGTIYYSEDVTTEHCFMGAFNSGSTALITKYDSSGDALWASVPTVTPDNSRFEDLAVDSSGNAYAVGYVIKGAEYNFGNSVTVQGAYTGGDPFTTYTNAVIVKYDSSGSTVWANAAVVAPNKTDFHSVVADSSGNVYAAGYVYGNGEFDFGNGVTVTGGYDGNNAVIVKYNSSGVAQWAKVPTTAPQESEIYGMAIDSSNNIYSSGYIFGSGQFGFGNGVVVSGGHEYYNATIVKYNSSGVAQWAKSTESAANYSYYNNIAVDVSGDIFAVGLIYENGEFDFGNNVTVSGNYSLYNNAVIVKYNSSGATQWAKSTVVAPNYSEFIGVTVDDYGNAYVGGYIVGNEEFDFGDDATITGPYTDLNAIIVKYDPSGTVEFVKSAVEGPDSSGFYGVTYSTPNVYATGYITGSGEYDFGSGIKVVGGGEENLIMIKYEDGVPVAEVSPDPDITSPVFSSFEGAEEGINITEGQVITINPYNIKTKPTDSGSGVKEVEFYVDDNLLCTDDVANADGIYDCDWDTLRYHSAVKVIAYDNSNNSAIITRNATVDLSVLGLSELPRTGR